MYWLTKEGVSTTEVPSARAEAPSSAKAEQSREVVLLFMMKKCHRWEVIGIDEKPATG
jgi:hypothetical protein